MHNDEIELKAEYWFKFILGGNSEFTLKNIISSNQFSYQVKINKNDMFKSIYSRTFFISVCYDYLSFRYAGFIRYNKETKKFVYSQGDKGHISIDSASIQGLLYILNLLSKQQFDARFKLYHFGRCGRCGRLLTDSISIEAGLGPECIKN